MYTAVCEHYDTIKQCDVGWLVGPRFDGTSARTRARKHAHARTHAHAQACTRARAHVPMHTCTCTCSRVHTNVISRTHMQMGARAHTHMLAAGRCQSAMRSNSSGSGISGVWMFRYHEAVGLSLVGWPAVLMAHAHTQAYTHAHAHAHNHVHTHTHTHAHTHMSAAVCTYVRAAGVLRDHSILFVASGRHATAMHAFMSHCKAMRKTQSPRTSTASGTSSTSPGSPRSVGSFCSSPRTAASVSVCPLSDVVVRPERRECVVEDLVTAKAAPEASQHIGRRYRLYSDHILAALAEVRLARGRQLNKAKVGSLFTGAGPERRAYKLMNVQARFMFACDCKVSALLFLEKQTSPAGDLPAYDHMFMDMRELINGCGACFTHMGEEGEGHKCMMTRETVDMLIAGCSCKPCSMVRTGRRGDGGTVNHADFDLYEKYLDFLVANTPNQSIFENVFGFLKTCKALKMPPIHWFLQRAIERGLGEIYDIRVILSNAKTWVTQSRRRVWILFSHVRIGGRFTGRRFTTYYRALCFVGAACCARTVPYTHACVRA